MENRLSQSNKGFTLVEICVTLVLFSMLASIATVSLIKWQEYATNQTLEDDAELIYMAARNKIAHLRANNSLEEFKGWAGNVSNGSNIKTSGVIEKDNIYFALCREGDYEHYLAGELNNNPCACLVFDLVSDYIYDKTMLNKYIAIEYSSNGVIYNVYYSDRTEMTYGGSNGNNKVNLKVDANLTGSKLFDNCIGAYKS